MIECDPRKLEIRLLRRFIMLLIVVCSLSAAYCNAEQSEDYAILLEESPAGAGYVTPEVGIHDNAGGVMDIRAVPKPGYRFLYWLGDVEESTENETTVTVDSPKIIVAVFSRTTQIAGGDSVTPGVALGGLRPSFLAPKQGGSAPTYPDPDDDPDPNPEPHPVPEPTTMALLAAGGLLTFRKRR